MRKFKIGLDIHGLIDADPQMFATLSKLLVDAGHEVHVLTGIHWTPNIPVELASYNIQYTHHFSIADYHKELGTPMTYPKPNRPVIDLELWNRSKADYCTRNKIDLCLDDSLSYGKYFTTSYAQVLIKKQK